MNPSYLIYSQQDNLPVKRIRITYAELRILCQVGGGTPARWPPSASQTARTVFPYAAFTIDRPIFPHFSPAAIFWSW